MRGFRDAPCTLLEEDPWDGISIEGPEQSTVFAWVSLVLGGRIDTRQPGPRPAPRREEEDQERGTSDPIPNIHSAAAAGPALGVGVERGYNNNEARRSRRSDRLRWLVRLKRIWSP